MARFSLAVAVILLYTAAALAQHSSAGSSSSGGGSHSSSSAGSSSSSSHSGGYSGSSASSHSSGGSVSHASSGSHSSASPGSSGSHSPNIHSPSTHSPSSASASSGSLVRDSRSNITHTVREPNTDVKTKTATSEKRGFFSFLRHPIKNPRVQTEPVPAPPSKPVVDLRRPICLRGPCRICPVGQVHEGGGCVTQVVINHTNRTNNVCSPWQFRSGGICLQQVRFLDDCIGLRMAMDRQAQRMQAAKSAQLSACSTGAQQECSDWTSTALSEASLYRELQRRYEMCRQQSLTAYPFSGFGYGGYSSGLFDPLGMDLLYP